MLGIALDVFVLAGLVAVLQGDEPEWLKLLFVAFGMAVVNFVIALLLGEFLGLFILVPIVLVDGLILMFFCHLTIKQAAIAVAVLFAYQIVFALLMNYLFATPRAAASAHAAPSLVWPAPKLSTLT